MPKIPDYRPKIAKKVLEDHNLLGKVSPDDLAIAAKAHDSKNPGYISRDEFELAAKALALNFEQNTEAPSGPTTSPLFARTAVVPSKANMSDKRVAFAKERILANAGGASARFGALDGGEGGLRAFTLDDKALAGIKDPALKDKLKGLDGDGALVAVLTTGDQPQLTITSVTEDQARIAGKYDLLTTDVLGGDDPLKAAAALFGGAPQLELGGEKAEFNLASAWSDGSAFKGRLEIQKAKVEARQAARAARQKAAADAMKGPSTPAEFKAAGVKSHKHTAAEKKMLLDMVKAGAGEDKTFPNPDESYYGLHVYLLEGADAAHALAFAQANFGGPGGFDPDKDSVLVTIKSFSEAQVGTFVVDRDKGEVTFGSEENSVDYDTKAVEKFFPGADTDDMFDAFVIGTLATKGEQLGVVAGEDTPDDMDFADWLEDATS